MSRYDDGRLILPGGKKELKPFKKEMKKLQNDWTIEMSHRYRRVHPQLGSDHGYPNVDRYVLTRGHLYAQLEGRARRA